MAVIIVALYLLQKMLMPKYVDNVVEGNLIKEYYKEENKEFEEFSKKNDFFTAISEVAQSNIYGSRIIF